MEEAKNGPLVAAMLENDAGMLEELKIAEEAMVKALGRTEKTALICRPIFESIIKIRGVIKTLDQK